MTDAVLDAAIAQVKAANLPIGLGSIEEIIADEDPQRVRLSEAILETRVARWFVQYEHWRKWWLWRRHHCSHTIGG